MSTNFETSFIDNNNDIIEADHVKQFAQPVNDLESGAAHYRAATNDSGVYQVDFRSSANPNGHAISALTAGQVIRFKASHDSPAAAEMKVLVDGGTGSETHDLYAGDAQVGADMIKAGQIVTAVFNDQGGGRFDVAAGGGGGSSGLADFAVCAFAPNKSTTGYVSWNTSNGFLGGDVTWYNETSGFSTGFSLANAGTYLVLARFYMQLSGGRNCTLALHVDGSAGGNGFNYNASSQPWREPSLSGLVSVTAGQRIEFYTTLDTWGGGFLRPDSITVIKIA